VTTPDDHLDPDAIAALDEGLDDDGARLAHVHSCEVCSRQLAQVRTTRALLSALPEEPMPADVAARVQAALPREPMLTTIVPRGARRRRWMSSPALAGLGAAAAAIALVAAISIGALRSSGHRSNNPGADAGGAAFPLSARTDFPVLASGANYTDANSPELISTLDGLVRTPSSPAPTSTPGRTTTKSQADSLTLSAHAPVPAELQQFFGDRRSILSCARLLAGGPVTPLAVDFARFSGGLRHVRNAPAMIILLPALGDLRDSAFIVGPKCLTDPEQNLYTFVQSVKQP
jgi:hypothetical protein